MNSTGKLAMESIIGTKTATILQFIQGRRGDLQVTFEEGTWAAWLYDLLRTAPSFGMARQNNGSRRAPSGRVLLPTARCTAGFAPTSAARSLGGESQS